MINWSKCSSLKREDASKRLKYVNYVKITFQAGGQRNCNSLVSREETPQENTLKNTL